MVDIIKKIYMCKVLYKTMLTKDVVRIVLENNELAQICKPGQFLNIKCGQDNSMVLRRPISINKASRERGTITIVFRIVGKGTELLSKDFDRGDLMDVMGPLGNGFEYDKIETNKKIAIVAGGMGVMPMLFLSKRLKDHEHDIFLGYRDKEDIMLESEYRKYTDNVFISTDDGSAGFAGFITDLFKKHLTFKNYDYVFACGPKPMFLNLKNILDLNGNAKTECQISMEEKMGCGIGACLVCSCKIKTQTEEGFDYKRVCKDGQVFNMKEVIFE